MACGECFHHVDGNLMPAQSATLGFRRIFRSIWRKPHGRAKCILWLSALISTKWAETATPRGAQPLACSGDSAMPATRPLRPFPGTHSPLFGRRARVPSPAPSTGYGRSQRYHWEVGRDCPGGASHAGGSPNLASAPATRAKASQASPSGGQAPRRARRSAATIQINPSSTLT